jgi:transposase
MMKVLGIEEFHRGFDTIEESYNELVRSRPKILEGITAGNINNITVAASLLDRAGPVRRLVADRAYDADHLRRRLARQRSEAVIPSTASRRKPIAYNKRAYRKRNHIERMRCRIKDWRRIATRYDKLARNYLSGAYFAAILACWLKGNTPIAIN